MTCSIKSERRLRLPNILSPILSDLTGFPPIDIFYGTREVMIAYLKDFQSVCKKYGVKLNTHIGKGMMHWIDNNREMVQSTGLLDTLPRDFIPTARNVDDHFTRRFFHFPDITTFYDQISCKHTLDGIRHPILFISTANDHFSMPEAFPQTILEEDCSDNVGAIITPSGGHMGMFQLFSTQVTFDEEILIQFFTYHFSRFKACYHTD